MVFLRDLKKIVFQTWDAVARLEMWWLISSVPDFWGPGFESGISLSVKPPSEAKKKKNSITLHPDPNCAKILDPDPNSLYLDPEQRGKVLHCTVHSVHVIIMTKN